MIDYEKLQPALEGYKNYFPTHFGGESAEKYKWEAVKHFQDHWDIDAENFGDMFRKATEKTFNLLASGYSYPREVIINFARSDDEATRDMFRDLFDESKDLETRAEAFRSASENMRAKYDYRVGRNHYQSMNAISTYLWLRYPDKYYIFKYELYKAAAEELTEDFRIKRDGSAATMIGGFKMYEEICEAIKADPDITEMIQSALTPECYPDPEMKTATIDFGFYLKRFYLEEEDVDEWFSADYDPGLTVDDWSQLLQDPSIFTDNSLQIMKRIKDYGGAATCKQLSVKYGENPNFYNGGSWSLAQRIAKSTGCPVMTKDTENSKWWPILYLGKKADENTDGAYIWKLRDELSMALGQVDLSEIPLYAETKPTIWKISHGTFDKHTNDEFAERKVAVIHGETNPIGTNKVSQGEWFREHIKAGDYFYLCHGNSIKLLGQFETDEAVPCPDLEEGWVERKYRIVKNSKDESPYRDVKKWWSPNANTTCVEIKTDEAPLFEEKILRPYFDMTLDELYGEDSVNGYWWLNASPKIWSFADIGIGEEQSYTLYNENGNKRRIFQNFLDAKAGDMVIGYEANPVKKIVAIGRISQEQDGEAIYFKKTEGLTSPIEYQTLKETPELENMEFFKQMNGSLFKLTKGEFDFIMDIIRESNPLPGDKANQKYTKEDFLSKVFMTEERYDVLEALLRNKKNIILQGAPGVGKTFTARKLAYAMMGEVDDSRIELIQFHQNYSYEDFIMGYRPDGSGFKLTDGIFYRFCQRAANNPDKDHFFIIDEINRGNMSKIFGELLMLIEKDYRGTKATLAYSGMPFSVPENLYIIGMMNTADRSLAMIDYALRRRFSFFELEPGFNSDGFTRYQSAFGNETFDALIDQIKQLNKEISEDRSLGRGFQIGHSYFCGREEEGCTDEWMRSVVEFDIIPMLNEYWFDEPEKLQRWENSLRGVFDD